ncbi:MAG TPA: DUF1269 domain-containing protein [Kofleriaceae bacterium]|nr:DUF1269 domain-containing protein [Kofleriaceae bacterium]
MFTGQPESGRRIIALAFESQAEAQEALQEALRLQDKDLLTLHDAVFVSRLEDGTIEIAETSDPTPVAAAVPSSLCGALVGTLLGGPLGFLIGGVLAGGGGALVAKLVDSGISAQVLSDLEDQTRPGQTVLALLVSNLGGLAVLEQLRHDGVRLAS